MIAGVRKVLAHAVSAPKAVNTTVLRPHGASCSHTALAADAVTRRSRPATRTLGTASSLIGVRFGAEEDGHAHVGFLARPGRPGVRLPGSFRTPNVISDGQNCRDR